MINYKYDILYLLKKSTSEYKYNIITDLIEILENRTSKTFNDILDSYIWANDNNSYGWRPFLEIALLNPKSDDKSIAYIYDKLINPITKTSLANKFKIRRKIRSVDDYIVRCLFSVLDTFNQILNYQSDISKIDELVTKLIIYHTEIITTYCVEDNFCELKKIIYRIKKYRALLKEEKKVKKGAKSKIYQALNNQTYSSFNYKDNQLLEWELVYKTLHEVLYNLWIKNQREKIECHYPNPNIPERFDVYIGGTLHGWGTIGDDLLYPVDSAIYEPYGSVLEKLVDLYKKNINIFLGDFISLKHYINTLPNIIDILYENILNEDLKYFFE
ncbi:MAG: hypothetical protein SOT14_01485 [Succinivibrio sp.]|nr:hypothetical protein [Succinivibrio sp.]